MKIIGKSFEKLNLCKFGNCDRSRIEMKIEKNPLNIQFDLMQKKVN